MNILSKTTSQFLTNTNNYGDPIYNEKFDEPEEKAAKVKDHFVKNMFTPGFMRSVEKMRKASEGEVGSYGSTATFDNIALSFLGLRVQQQDLTSDRFLVDPLKQYLSLSTDLSKKFTKKNKLELEGLNELGDLNEKQTERKAELEGGQTKVEKGRKTLIAEVSAEVKAFKALSIPEDRIKEALKMAKIPLYIRKAQAETYQKD